MDIVLIIAILGLIVSIAGLIMQISGGGVEGGGGVFILLMLLGIGAVAVWAIISKLKQMPSFSWNNPTSIFAVVVIIFIIIVIIIRGVTGDL